MAVLTRETASESIEDVLRGLAPLTAARITYVETRAALAARRRSRRLSRRDFADANRELTRRWSELDVVELDADVAEAAGAAAERYSLGSHDAIQLASALQLGDRHLVLVALDDRLRHASRRAGLAVAP